MIYFQSLTRPALCQLLRPWAIERVRRGLSLEEQQEKAERKARYQAKQIFNWVYQREVTDWAQMTDLSKDLRSWLAGRVQFYQLSEATSNLSEDGTHKFLWQLGDRKTIESVVIPAALQEKEISEFSGAPAGVDTEWKRLTACISSQVGCAMGCKFCLTGIQGLDRHLETHEIVAQIQALRRKAPITNIVFMGMGEPLHNLKNVTSACQIFLDQEGFNFSKRKVTVSTSGIAPAMKELFDATGVSLAVSLNASHDEQRARIMPVNRRWPIADLMKTCQQLKLGRQRQVTFEYVLLAGVNDSLADADRVVKLMQGVRGKINLIPLNEHPGSSFSRPSEKVIADFQQRLIDRGIIATVRISRGRDILAACGQLKSLFGTARGTERQPVSIQ